MGQSPAVALTTFADARPRAIETEIGVALCTIGAERTLTLSLIQHLHFEDSELHRYSYRYGAFTMNTQWAEKVNAKKLWHIYDKHQALMVVDHSF